MGKAFEKQIKLIQYQEEKQIETLENLKPKEQTKLIERVFPEGYESFEIKNEINKIKEYENNKSIETIWFIIQAKYKGDKKNVLNIAQSL